MNNTTYVIFDVIELNKIDFEQVLETSADTLRRSVDGTKTFVKWNTDQVPWCVQALSTKGDFLTRDQIIAILDSPEWTFVDPNLEAMR